MIILKASGVDLTLSGIHILSKINLSIAAGKIHSVIGPNGAGKTSLMNCITGYYKPKTGRVSFKEKDITGLASHKIARLGVSRMFQHIEIVNELSVIDNVLLGRHTHLDYNTIYALLWWGKARKQEVKNRIMVQKTLKYLGLEGIEMRTAGSLSYGTQKRIEMARAIVGEPSILILDEPTSGMNRKEKEEIVQAILNVQKYFIPTIILIEHDMRIVMQISDTISVMNFGTMIAEGAPSEVQNNDEVVKAYLGERKC